MSPSRRYLLVSPCRNEADYMVRTLESVTRQSLRPALWVIVDDGSTDATPAILADYAARHDWIKVVTKPDRGKRAVGPGVIEAFYFGLNQVDWTGFDYLCKLDLDLDLPLGYFQGLVTRMEADPRLGSASGKPWFTGAGGARIPEKIGDEMSVGMTKFYRRRCFQAIGGFVQEVMWDGIDCHKTRQLGWTCRSFPDAELEFEHLRPMGSSQQSIFTGRKRHGFGQYYMGSDFAFFTASCLSRLTHPPYVLGALASWWGYVDAALRRLPQHQDRDLITLIRAYQRRALIVGKARATAEVEAAHAHLWRPE
ncbi:glycosyltransferase [Rhodobacter sp. KR11]|uniref:glycosyltransferase n=1 Tax=Rhodobacter sp. KR11 TaxID=2974588 RepID=UPI002221D392|nr:glycosyltransferase [Rhodobacter sp. KR11]MCW1920775.1 glycosyltransferase [Rhodobacter sp. KR11]